MFILFIKLRIIDNTSMQGNLLLFAVDDFLNEFYKGTVQRAVSNL